MRARPEPLELVYERSRLDEELDGFAQADKSVNYLTQKVEWELMPGEDVHEEFLYFRELEL